MPGLRPSNIEPQPVPGARWVPLTKGYFALVDEADYERVSSYSWFAMVKPSTVYACRGRLSGERGPRTVRMHRVLAGTSEDQVTDHADGNGLNNRRANLRTCSVRENNMNRRRRSTKFKGVTYVAGRGKWRATIRANAGPTHIGYFKAPEDAARAYDAAARKYFGEFAVLNFPEAA